MTWKPYKTNEVQGLFGGLCVLFAILAFSSGAFGPALIFGLCAVINID